MEVWVFLKLGRAEWPWVDRLMAVLAGGCACWWLCLLVALLAAEVGGCAARQSMRLSGLAVSAMSCFWLD